MPKKEDSINVQEINVKVGITRRLSIPSGNGRNQQYETVECHVETSTKATIPEDGDYEATAIKLEQEGYTWVSAAVENHLLELQPSKDNPQPPPEEEDNQGDYTTEEERPTPRRKPAPRFNQDKVRGGAKEMMIDYINSLEEYDPFEYDAVEGLEEGAELIKNILGDTGPSVKQIAMIANLCGQHNLEFPDIMKMTGGAKGTASVWIGKTLDSHKRAGPQRRQYNR